MSERVELFSMSKGRMETGGREEKTEDGGIKVVPGRPKRDGPNAAEVFLSVEEGMIQFRGALYVPRKISLGDLWRAQINIKQFVSAAQERDIGLKPQGRILEIPSENEACPE